MADATKRSLWVLVGLFLLGAVSGFAGNRYVTRPEAPLDHDGPFRAYVQTLHVTRPVGLNLGGELVPGTVLRPNPDGTYSVEAWVNAESYANPQKLEVKASEFLTAATFEDKVNFDDHTKLALPGMDEESVSASVTTTSASHVLTILEVLESRTLAVTDIWSAGPRDTVENNHLAARIKTGELVVVAQTVHAKKLYYGFAKSSEWNTETRAKFLSGDADAVVAGKLSNKGWMRFNELAVGFQKVAVALPAPEKLVDPQDRAALVDDLNRSGVAAADAGNPVFAVVEPEQVAAIREMSRIGTAHFSDKRKLEAEVTSRDLTIATANEALTQRGKELDAQKRQSEETVAMLRQQTEALAEVKDSVSQMRTMAAQTEEELRGRDDRIAQLENQLGESQERVKQLQKDVGEKAPALKDALAASQSLRDELAAARLQIGVLEREKAGHEKLLQKRDAELALAKEALASAQKDAAAAIDSASRLENELAVLRAQRDARVAGAADWSKLRASLLAAKKAAELELRDASAAVLKLTDRKVDPNATIEELLAFLPKRESGDVRDLVRQLLRVASAQAVIRALADVR